MLSAVLVDDKTCTKCGELKEAHLFYTHTQGGKMPHCKECHKAAVLSARAKNPEKYLAYQRECLRRSGRHLFIREQRRTCLTCREVFTPTTHNHSYCTQVCQVRARTLRLKYGLSPEAWMDLLEQSGGRCTTCFREEKLVIDHCHATGVVRGLLCQRCNVGLGLAGDDPEVLRALAQYVEQFR